VSRALGLVTLGVSRDGYSKLRSGLELHDSRVSGVDVSDGVATVHFSHAYIHKSAGTPGRDRGTGWSQEAWLVLSEVENLGSMPHLPNTIAEGFLEVGGIEHQVIPLPFRRKVGARLSLVFVDGTQLEIVGNKPFVELQGAPIYLEDFP
jgi:hypothetical protein